MTPSIEWSAAILSGVMFLGCGTTTGPIAADGSGGTDGGSLPTTGATAGTEGATAGSSATTSASMGGTTGAPTTGATGDTTMMGTDVGTTASDTGTPAGPPVIPPPGDFVCVDDPQTLAELGACQGIWVGNVLNAGITAQENTDILLREFNSVVLENAMKWDAVQATEGVWSFAAADRLLNITTQRPLVVKGHTMIWHSQLPAWVPASLPTQADIDALMTAHINEIGSYYADTVFVWDVVNEAIDDDATPRETVWSTPTGGTPSLDYISTAFTLARAAAPNAELFYNDYNIDVDGAKAEAAITMVSDMVAAGVPIDGVGFQTHATESSGPGGFYDPEDARALMQRYAAIGIKVNFTEFDVRAGAGAALTELEEAQIYYDYVRVCIEEPNCDAFIFWGISDADSWIPGTFEGATPYLLYNDDFSESPAFEGTVAALRGDPRPE